MDTQAMAGQVEPAARRPRWEVADIMRAYGPKYLKHNLVSALLHMVLRALMACRTAALGGHLEVCLACGYQQAAYNSCRNRHCPKCQGVAQTRWLAERKARILPVGHFHVVFTLPEALRPLTLRNPQRLYGLLFEAASQTLLTLGRDPKHLGAQLGITAVLHTWSRTLSYHPHLHCIVTGGGLSLDQSRWVDKPGRFLFPVQVLGKLFRAKFVSKLRALYHKGVLDLGGPCAPYQQRPAFDALVASLFSNKWVVYAKRPLGGAAQVFAYLGRYTHRVGLSNYRIRSVDERGVRFRTRQGKSCTLAPLEFIRRFLLHVLPTGFVKVRHYGLLASSNVDTKLARAKSLLAATSKPGPSPQPDQGVPEQGAGPPPSQQEQQPQGHKSLAEQVLEWTGRDIRQCPRCQRGPLLVVPLAQLGRDSWRADAGAVLDTC